MENTATAPQSGAQLCAQIERAVQQGERTVTIHGRYEIEQTVTLPSDFTLILDGAHLRLREGTFCRIFENRCVRAIDRGEVPVPDRHIHIIGKNGATLDGGVYNGLSERNYKSSPYHICVNNLLLFANVSDFSVQGIRCVRQRWWALNFINCSDGVLRDIDFLADASRRLPDGRVVQGLTHKGEGAYASVCVKNADGIDLRLGCRNILIENISGFTEDDTVAITALHHEVENLYARDVAFDGIRDITVRHVHACSFCTLVRLLNEDGTSLCNITIEDVRDTVRDFAHCLDGGIYAVRVGDTTRYGDVTKPVVPPENITIRDVCAQQDTLVSIVGEVHGLHTENIRTCRDDQTAIQHI